jgi:integrase
MLYRDSISPATRKDYVRRWRRFDEWCRMRDLEALGCASEVVMLFLSDCLGGSGTALGTLRGYVAAINRVHVEAGFAPPGDDPAMVMFLRTLSRTTAPTQPQRDISALKIGPLREVCLYLDGLAASAVEVRDRASLCLTRAGLTDGEQARLRWDEVTLRERSASLLLRSSRAGRPDRTVTLRSRRRDGLCPVRALTDWHAGGAEGPLVFLKTDASGGVDPSPVTAKFIYRLRRSRLDSLTAGEGRDLDQAISLLGATRPEVARDKALLLIGFAGAFRRPDLVGLRWSDVTEVDRGVVLRLRRSKTDRQGDGVDVGIPRGVNRTTDPVAALNAWRQRMHHQLGAAATESAPVFSTVGRAGRIGTEPLSTTAVTVIVRTRMREVGIPGRWSGRSLRRGFISTAADAGIRLEEIAKGSRHATLDSLIRYIATEDPWRSNPTARLGM